MKRAVIYICILLLTLPHAAIQVQEFGRSTELKTSAPKGQWILGNSTSYSERSESSYNFPITEGISSGRHIFKVSSMLCCTFKDNLATDSRFGYAYTFTRLGGVTINVDDDNQFDLDDMYQLEHSYAVMVMMRNYISLGNSKRFELYYDIQPQMGGSQPKMISGTGEGVTGTCSTSTDLNIGAAPGVVVFINNYTVIEVSVGALGFDFSKTRQTTNQVYTDKRSLNSANLHINLFSIGLGIVLYL